MEVVEITDIKVFEKILEGDYLNKKHGKKYLCVDFYADWCKPCKKFAPTYEKFAKEYGDKIFFAKSHVDKCEELSNKYNVYHLPDFKIFKLEDNETKDKPIYSPNKDTLEELFKNICTGKINILDDF